MPESANRLPGRVHASLAAIRRKEKSSVAGPEGRLGAGGPEHGGVIVIGEIIAWFAVVVGEIIARGEIGGMIVRIIRFGETVSHLRGARVPDLIPNARCPCRIRAAPHTPISFRGGDNAPVARLDDAGASRAGQRSHERP